MSSLHDRIRTTRLLRKMSQSQLARLAGVSQPTVANWESGGQYPRQAALPRICEALGIDTVWLLNGALTTRPDIAAPAYLAQPLRHVPVYSWPLRGGSLDRTQPAAYVAVSTHAENLFALTSNGKHAPIGAVLVFEEVDSETGPWLIQSGEHHILGDADGTPKTLGRLHTTIITH